MEIDANGIPNFLENTQSNQLDSARTPSKNQADASLRIDCASVIDQARESPKADPEKIQNARELLLSGQLESRENINLAAQNIGTFGI